MVAFVETLPSSFPPYTEEMHPSIGKTLASNQETLCLKSFQIALDWFMLIGQMHNVKCPRLEYCKLSLNQAYKGKKLISLFPSGWNAWKATSAVSEMIQKIAEDPLSNTISKDKTQEDLITKLVSEHVVPFVQKNNEFFSHLKELNIVDLTSLFPHLGDISQITHLMQTKDLMLKAYLTIKQDEASSPLDPHEIKKKSAYYQLASYSLRCLSSMLYLLAKLLNMVVSPVLDLTLTTLSHLVFLAEFIQITVWKKSHFFKKDLNKEMKLQFNKIV